MKSILPVTAAITAAFVAVGAVAWLASPPRARAQGRQISVLDGVYTDAQAKRGQEVYSDKCSECHEGTEPNGPELNSSAFVDNWREDSLSTLFNFIKTDMPQDAQGTLSEAQYLDILAFILQNNNYKPGAKELTADSVKNVLFVGETGPQPLPPNASVRVTGCFSGSGAAWQISKAVDPNRTRETDSISDAELKAAAGRSGTRTFHLRNLDNVSGFKPESGVGHNVVVKGVLITDTINVLALNALPSSCTP